MSQCVIDVENSKQADALIRYRESLDFVKLTPVEQGRKVQAAAEAKAFLKGLPDQSAEQSDFALYALQVTGLRDRSSIITHVKYTESS
ncbi:hypothetical protein ACFSUS_05925 [Spirosoma soli]|uniref:Uncharacterized protein n=1 Tax=Spirosoma soli TaxID=1770529 RepID=A0ABW5M216_9BACT